ncbi:hypothetical protein BYT27DRAFT_7241676 [Phlegmacium glaucopus]|nr:hypothetical protein BYT27DRAFT_7241676 [Phlegmacium glaucopus]
MRSLPPQTFYTFFVSKQPTLIEINDIHQVIFSPVGAGAGISTGQTFDLRIVARSGPEPNCTFINRDEHEETERYLKDKKIPDADLLLAAVADDDDDMQNAISSDSDSGKSGQKKFSRVARKDRGILKAPALILDPPSDSDSDPSGAKTASDASGDIASIRDAKKGGKKQRTAKKTSRYVFWGQASVADSDADENDSKAKAKPNATAGGADGPPKPKSKPKAKEGLDDDATDVDEEHRNRNQRPRR